MSPEQAQGKTVDHRTDIWALGVTIYEMVTGRRPFDGESEYAILYQIINEDPEPMPEIQTGVPGDLQRIVAKAMTKSLDGRYQYISDMLMDLRWVNKKLATAPTQTKLRTKIMRRSQGYSILKKLFDVLCKMREKTFKDKKNFLDFRLFGDRQKRIEQRWRESEIDQTKSENTFSNRAVRDRTGINVKQARIFLSYKRNSKTDEKLVLQLFEDLKRQYDVFIDQSMVVGMPWVQRLEAELKQSDFLIVLLSSQSIHSEMVKAEIETAHRLAKVQNGRPVILPVRVNFQDPFPYPLSAYLDHINWACWNDETDTPRLINELRQAVSGGVLPIDQAAKGEFIREGNLAEQAEPLPAAQPVRLEMPEGTNGS